MGGKGKGVFRDVRMARVSSAQILGHEEGKEGEVSGTKANVWHSFNSG